MNIQYEGMGIYDLRNFARSVGVASPTTKKKNQLIYQINLIKTNQMQPQKNKSKQGRPPKIQPVKSSENANLLSCIVKNKNIMKQLK